MRGIARFVLSLQSPSESQDRSSFARIIPDNGAAVSLRVKARMDTDVLVVGAGPTGLMLANQLVRRGVGVRIIDRHAGPAQQTRALGVQARTLEIYARLGIAGRALELGKIANGANMWAQGRKMARVPLGDAGRFVTPYPYILILGQDDNERIMGDRLRELGLSVEWNTELVGIEQQADGVAATLKLPDGSSETIRAAWVGGCDGARSSVRELNGITFPGAPYEHVFFVADVEMTGTMVADELNVYLWRDGFHLLFPMRGKDHWRIVGILPAGLRKQADVQFDAVLPSFRDEVGAVSIKSCTWFSTYRIHHRRARALPRPPLLPARRRRAHPQPGRRARHEHRPAGCLQSGVEAGAGGQGAGRRRLARFLRGRAPAGGANACWRRPTAPSGWWSRTAGSPACCARRYLPGSRHSR